MKKLHNRSISDNNLEPKEGQRDLLCSNKASLHFPLLKSSSFLSKETINALEELGRVLASIQKRMTYEGYEIVNGNICKIEL